MRHGKDPGPAGKLNHIERLGEQFKKRFSVCNEKFTDGVASGRGAFLQTEKQGEGLKAERSPLFRGSAPKTCAHPFVGV